MTTRKAFIVAASAAGSMALMGAGQQPAQEKLYSPAELQADLDGIWQALLDVGAEPFRTSSREHVETMYRTARASMTAPMPVLQAWLTIAPILGALNDGHVSLGFPDKLNDAAFAFPLSFVLSNDNELIVRSDDTRTIPIGGRILSINGVSAAKYIPIALTTLGAQTPWFHRSRFTHGGAWPSIAVFGTGPEYRVRWATSQNVASEVVISASSSSPTNASKTGSIAPYTYETIREGQIGYIDYKSCEDLERFETFLATTFSQIEAAPIRALVVDIRRNGGGNSRLNNELWQYAANKPFKQFGGVIVKSCDRLKREYGQVKYVSIYGDSAWNAPNGTLITREADPNAGLVEPRPLATRYGGPVYLLISVATFSSAMSCALAAKDYGLATIVGEETGEPVNSTGEIYEYVTPNIGLRAWLTTKVFLAPKPHPDGQGVVPDVAVATTTDDVAAGRDPVLDRAIALALG